MMNKNKEQFNECSGKQKILLYHWVYYKKDESIIYNSAMCIEDRQKLYKFNSKCCPNKLTLNNSNFHLYFSYNKVTANFNNLQKIYQYFILQFAVVIIEAQSPENSEGMDLSNIPADATKVLVNVQDKLCKIYEYIYLKDYICDKPYIAILVTLIFFILLFSIISLICCKCCCKKKESEESSLDYDQFIMDPNGQMYSAMYQGQMMQSQMIPGVMMYPQIIPGGLMYPQMLQGGMMTPQMYQAGIQ
ncbi:hypothetical protein, conserved [Plasmodium vivax]|uniref:Uncharacterized protein n=1 Tax=Plasmodium vivax TaxID=5855 RepID=A0A1G4GWZ6_PLAVI|nr:hypothetical protein, conserved [Plasmodium vivax]